MPATEFLMTPAYAKVLLEPNQYQWHLGRMVLLWLISKGAVRHENGIVTWGDEDYGTAIGRVTTGKVPEHVQDVMRWARDDEPVTVRRIAERIGAFRQRYNCDVNEELVQLGLLNPIQKRILFFFRVTDWELTPQGAGVAAEIRSRIDALKVIGQPGGPDAPHAALLMAAAGSLVFLCPWLEDAVTKVPGLQQIVSSSSGGDVIAWPDLGSDFDASFDSGSCDGGGDGGGGGGD